MIQLSNSLRLRLAAAPGMAPACLQTWLIAPVLHSARGKPLIPCLLCLPCLRRGVRNDWAKSRARGARMVLMRASHVPVSRRHTGGGPAHRRRAVSRTGPQKQVFACVPHAAVLSACNSQRRHALGALTECLASPHCWVLGPPTSSAGHRPFTTPRTARLMACRRAKGPHTRRGRRIPLRAADEKRHASCRSGTGA